VERYPRNFVIPVYRNHSPGTNEQSSFSDRSPVRRLNLERMLIPTILGFPRSAVRAKRRECQDSGASCLRDNSFLLVIVFLAPCAEIACRATMIKAFRVKFSTVDFAEWECIVEFSLEDGSCQTELEDKAKEVSVKTIIEWWETLDRQGSEGTVEPRDFEIFALTDSELMQVGPQYVPIPLEPGVRMRVTRAPQSFGGHD